MNEEWIDGFDSEMFKLNSRQINLSGVTLQSIRFVEMMASLVND